MFTVLFKSNSETLTWGDDCSCEITVTDSNGNAHSAHIGENDTYTNVKGDLNIIRAASWAHSPKCPENIPYEQSKETLVRWGMK